MTLLRLKCSGFLLPEYFQCVQYTSFILCICSISKTSKNRDRTVQFSTYDIYNNVLSKHTPSLLRKKSSGAFYSKSTAPFWFQCRMKLLAAFCYVQFCTTPGEYQAYFKFLHCSKISYKFESSFLKLNIQFTLILHNIET